MAEVLFPPELPYPSAEMRIQPVERRALSTMQDGKLAIRPRSRDFRATIDLSWTFRREQLRVFNYWGMQDLAQWGRWFSIVLPGRGGYVARICRFIKEPIWSYISESDSEGLWAVTAQLEQRGLSRQVFAEPVPAIPFPLQPAPPPKGNPVPPPPFAPPIAPAPIDLPSPPPPPSSEPSPPPGTPAPPALPPVSPPPATYGADTVMVADGIFRQGGISIYTGFTNLSGTGTVRVYKQRTASGTIIHTVVNPPVGVFQSVGTPVEGGAFYISRGGMTIACRVGD